MAETSAISDSGGVAPAENFRADCEMQFVHQIGPEQGVIQSAAAFAEQTSNTPFPAQPAKCLPEINFAPAANLYYIRQSP